jgi:hypothetical protein
MALSPGKGAASTHQEYPTFERRGCGVAGPPTLPEATPRSALVNTGGLEELWLFRDGLRGGEGQWMSDALYKVLIMANGDYGIWIWR